MEVHELKLNNILDIINQIPEETCGGKQPEFLFELSLKTKGIGEVVEIGTNVGKSTIALAYASKVIKGGPIYSIDIYEHPDIIKNLKKAEVGDYVIRIVQPSHIVSKKWRKPIKLLWIDGDHSYRGVSHDIRNWSHFLEKGGIIAFHDYPGHKKSKEVWKAVSKYLLQNPYMYRLINDRDAGSIIAFQKISDDSEKAQNAGILNSLYWLYRDIRTMLVEYFPNQARKYKNKKI